MIKFDCLWEMMKEKKLTKTQLRIAARLSTSTFAKLTKNEMVSLMYWFGCAGCLNVN